MYDKDYVAENGVTVRWIDMGEEFEYRGKTLQVVGKWASGEISTGSEVQGYYLRDSDTMFVSMLDGRTFTLCEDDDYEDFALEMLR